MGQQSQYLSYLLRLWQEGGGDPPLWRASLESPQSEEPQRFSGLNELFAYLRERTDIVPPAGGFGRGQRTPETSSE